MAVGWNTTEQSLPTTGAVRPPEEHGMTTRPSHRQLDAFVKYASIMERVKKRIRKIERITKRDASSRDEWEETVEDLATELKRVLEDLPYACLGLKIPNLGRRASRYRKNRPPQLIKSDVNGEKLLPAPQRRPGPPFVVLDTDVPASDCMTSAQWESAWAWCNRFAHSRNPASEGPELTLRDLRREWGAGVRFVQRIINLLDTHFVVAKGPMDIHGTVRMAAGLPPSVVVTVVIRATPWASEIKMPGGAVYRLERKTREGAWERAPDGEISLHEVIGHCTRDGFSRA